MRYFTTLYECHLSLGCEFSKYLKLSFEYYFSLSKTELSSSLCVTTSAVLGTLATTVSCVGIVETLYTTLTHQVVDSNTVSGHILGLPTICCSVIQL